MVKSTLIGISLFAAVLTVAACEGLVPTTSSSSTATTRSAPVSAGGRVVYHEQDGGFFGIIADNGRQYEPTNLDIAYHVEGLRVKFTGQGDTTALGRHAWGNPIELAQVEPSK